jgi:hypothetical protein
MIREHTVDWNTPHGVARAGSSSANRLHSSSPPVKARHLGSLSPCDRIYGLLRRIQPSRRRDDA